MKSFVCVGIWVTFLLLILHRDYTEENVPLNRAFEQLSLPKKEISGIVKNMAILITKKIQCWRRMDDWRWCLGNFSNSSGVTDYFGLGLKMDYSVDQSNLW